MLTNTKIKNLKPKDKVYRVTDQHGLCLEIRTTGKKFWRYRFRFDGKASMLPLGEYPLVSLAEARELHLKARKLIQEGINPVTEKKERELKEKTERLDLFAHHVVSYFERMEGRKSESYIRNMKNNIDRHILPSLGHRPITEIDAMDVITMMNNTLEKVRGAKNYGTGEVTAEKCRQQTGLIFRHAMRYTKGLYDPTIACKGEIERPPIQHARDLTREELRELMHKLSKYNGYPSTKGVIWTMLYTIARTKEARNMRWEHIDLERKLWSIPLAEISRRKKGDRNMKTDRPHMIPLSEQMINLIENMRPISGSSIYVFPSQLKINEPIAPTTVNYALKNMGIKDVSGHDTRATCSTYLHEMGYNTDHINFQMAHVDNTVSGGYNHAKWLPERKEMLQNWANYLDELKMD